MSSPLHLLPAIGLVTALVLSAATTSAAADQGNDSLKLVRLTTRPGAADSAADVIPFQAVVDYNLQTVPNGFLVLFVFENGTNSARLQSPALPVQGSGQSLLNIDYPRPSRAGTLTLMIGLFKSEQKMLTWVSTAPIDLAQWPGRAAFDKAITARLNADYAGADRYLATAIGASPQMGAYYYWRGDTRIYLNRYDDAIADFDRSIALMPDDRASYAGRGIALLWKGEAAPAVADLTFAIDHGSDFDRITAFAYRARGTAYAMLHQPMQAIADYRAYLELMPTATDRTDVEGWIVDLS